MAGTMDNPAIVNDRNNISRLNRRFRKAASPSRPLTATRNRRSRTRGGKGVTTRRHMAMTDRFDKRPGRVPQTG